MPKLAILTDSCASIPEHLIKTLKIHVVAYYIHRGQEVLRDLVSIQRQEFIQWLQTATVLPTTASPGPGDYLEAFEDLVSQGVEEILSIHMTSKGSGAYQAAKVAQSMFTEKMPQIRVEVVDTLNVSLCQGWMAIEAARSAIAGKSLDEAAALVKRMIPAAKMLQTADTLKYLYMGGRIGRAKHMVGSLLNIKPLISMTDGVIIPVGQARSRLRVYQMMVDLVESVVGPQGRIKVAFVHAGAREEVEQLKEMIEARLTCIESMIAELSPALAVHTGPGTSGLCYIPCQALEE
jgi:DegV family protein with EDD domain